MSAIESEKIASEAEAPDADLETSVRTVEDLASAAVQLFERSETGKDPKQKALGRVLQLLEEHADAASRSWRDSQQSPHRPEPVEAPAAVAGVPAAIKVVEPAANVTPLPGAQQKQPGRLAAFNQIWSDYLAARADAARPGKTDEENRAASERLNELIWQVIKTPADGGHQVSCKLELLAELLGVTWNDRRDLALITSIRSDVERIG